MGKKRKAKIDEPRPVCPECGAICKPEDAVPFGRAKELRMRVFEGIYCSSDCLLDAIKRGWPEDRCRKVE